ncbi:MAG: hypothetical protein WC807_01465 [Hyphomicrobium sp.]|jgi:hypothetical protein
MTETLAGLLAVAVPALIIGVVVLGRTRPVLFMYLAALAVGLGYLTVTGSVDDIGKQALSYMPNNAVQPEAKAPAAAAPQAAASAPAGTEPAAGPAAPTPAP